MQSDAVRVLLVHTTVANEDDARRLAEDLVASGLAACVSIGAPVTSIFRWESEAAAGSDPAGRPAVQSEREIPLVIKTSADAYPALERRLEQIHPYELPEIVAVPVERGLSAFVTWIEEETVPRR